MTPEELKEHATEFASYLDNKPHNKLDLAYDAFLKERNEPKLYDGLTKAQWAIVRDEKLLCIVYGDSLSAIGALKAIFFDNSHKFGVKGNAAIYQHCRIHPSQPQFCNGTRPEGLDDNQGVLARFSLYKGVQYMPIKSLVGELAWKYVERYQVVNL